MADIKFEVTGVDVFRFDEPKGKNKNLLGMASVTFSDLLIVKGFKIIEGQDGPFVATPSTYNKNKNRYYDDVIFNGAGEEGSLGRKLSNHVKKMVLDKYEEGVRERNEFSQSGTSESFDNDDDVPF